MLRTLTAGLLCCGALLLAGCNCGGDAVDAGARDAGGADAGGPDAGGADAGGADAGGPDAGAGDAGPAVDSGAPDGGPADAGAPIDAGSDDGGAVPCAMDCSAVVAPPLTLPDAGLVLWLRADVGVRAALPTHRVCGWCDLSGVDNHLTARSTAQQPLAVAASTGGQPAITWGDLEVLERSDTLGIAPTSGRTLVMVVRLDDSSVRSAPFYQGLRGSLSLWWALDPNIFRTVGNRFGAYLSSNAFDTARSSDLLPHVHVVTVDSWVPGGVVGSVLHYHVDGALQALTATPGSSPTALVEDFSSANTTMLGYGGPARMTISEVLVYDRPLPDAERQGIEQALRARYGL